MENDIDIGFKRLPNRDNHNCFGCSPANACGLQMTFFTDDRSVFSWLKVPDHLCGWDNLVHGGVISTIMDETMSWSAIYLLKKIILTKSLTVEFIKPLRVGTELKSEGRVFEQKNDREAVMQGVIYNGKEEACARARGTFALLEPKVATRLNMMSADALKDMEPILNA